MKFPTATAIIFVATSSSAAAFSSPGSSFLGGSKFGIRTGKYIGINNGGCGLLVVAFAIQICNVYQCFCLSFFLQWAAPSRTARKSTENSSSSMTMTATGLKRVVVTGMGIVSCLGNTLEDVKASLHEAKSGITFSEEYEELGIKSQVRGIPDLSDKEIKDLIPKQSFRFCGTNAKYAYLAMDRAVQDSGLKPEEYQDNARVAGIIGQGGTSIPDIVQTVNAVEGGGRWKNKVGPFRVTRSMGSTCSAVLATAFKINGPSFSISSACSTGAHCIGTGFEQIQLGKSDIAFCGAGTHNPTRTLCVVG